MPLRPAVAWVIVGVLTIGVMAVTTAGSLARYHELRSGWSWDLAYYNQWFWAMTHGDGQITVRPGSAYANEGPSVWKTNYLSPVRFALLPGYALWPDPRTLIVVNVLVFWCVIPAAYTLVRSESGSPGLGVAAALLVPLTPLAWLLAVNDFRELQLAAPFVVWAIQGWRQRSRAVAAFGIAGLLACRQEFALLVMSLPLLPPRQPETPARRRAWTTAVVATGALWGIVFLSYLASRVDPHAPASYLAQFNPSSATPAGALGKALEFLVAGLASWTVLALFAPRVALLAIPWAWVLASGHFDLHGVTERTWHHVRYAAPLAALALAAGLVGFVRASRVAARAWRFGAPALWATVAVGLAAQGVAMQQRFAQVPLAVAPADVARVWSLVAEVGPAEGVLAAYDVTAPLSSRRLLYSYELPENRPPGYPRLMPDITWAFVKAGALPEALLLAQRFQKVHEGPSFHVYRRLAAGGPSSPGGQQ